MPRLANVRHEAFARNYLRLNGNGRQAYKAAGYRAAFGLWNGSRPADACAARLLAKDSVRARVEELRTMAAERHDVTEDSLVRELDETRAKALELGQTGPAVQATMGKARITGHIVDRKEVGQPGDFERMSEQELRAYIALHLGQPAAVKADSDRQTHGTAQGLPSAPTQPQHTDTANADAGLNEADGAELHTSRALPTHTGPDTKQ